MRKRPKDTLKDYSLAYTQFLRVERMIAAGQTTIRLRHYTRTSSRDRILSEGCLLARDQHKVFVEQAGRPPFNPRQAEAKYLLKRGKGNAYVEFDALPIELYGQTNALTEARELFLVGDVDLLARHPQGFDNS